MVDLGTLGGSYSGAGSVSESGQIVGLSLLAGDADSHPFSWTAQGAMVDLGTLGGSNTWNMQVSGVNERGQIAGTSTTADGLDHATLWCGRVNAAGRCKPKRDKPGS
jgi:probable HAF family extracellular repeat protein